MFVKVPKLVHAKYHAVCAEVPAKGTHGVRQAYKQDHPVKFAMCSETAKTIFNWASVAFTLPALAAHRDLTNMMYWFDTENAEDRVNDILKEALAP